MILARIDEKSNKEPAEPYNELALVVDIIIPSRCYRWTLAPESKTESGLITVLSELPPQRCIAKETGSGNIYDRFGSESNLPCSKAKAVTSRLHSAE